MPVGRCRLRYSVARIVNPPFAYDSLAEMRRALGAGLQPPALLAARVLTHIPGHFRQLARMTATPEEAFALENFGWLLMSSLRDSVAGRTGRNWWIPPAPIWVTPWASTLPSYSSQLQSLITRSLLIDTTLTLGDFRARQRAWRGSLAGRQWGLESGADRSAAGRPAGEPFYPELITVPASINVAAEKTRIDAVWTRRLADADAAHTALSPASTALLRQCDNARVETLGLISGASLHGLELTYNYPALTSGARPRTSLRMLRPIHPAVEHLCRTIVDLGWQDLLLNTGGAFCFRGIKRPAGSATFHSAARRLSDHGYAVAMDLHAFEMPAGNAHATWDPRIPKLFETCRFTWGKCFGTPDPHHFEYTG